MRKIIIATLSIIPSVACSAYRCVDDKGSTHFEDTPPAACANAPIMEVSRSGVVLRTLAPAAAPKREEAKAPIPEDRAALDQQRHDRALLDSYTSEREIEAARDRNIEIIRGRISATQLRLRQVTLRESNLDRSLQAYKDKSSPASQRTSQDLQAAREERQAIEASIERLGRDVEKTRQRFDGDKARWAELHDKRRAHDRDP
jgi:hypothetical protein